MNHLLIAPIVLPALVAPFIIMALRYHIDLQRIFSLASNVLLVAIAMALAVQAADGTVQVYELGDWQAPFGIVLVLDRLAALMLVLTSVLADTRVLILFAGIRSTFCCVVGWNVSTGERLESGLLRGDSRPSACESAGGQGILAD